MRNFTLLTLLLFFAVGASKANPDNPLKANTEPNFEVSAHYYPDSRYERSAYTRVLWGSTFYDFESQGQDLTFGWINDSIFPWTVTQPRIDGYHGGLCMMSGNGGYASSSSSIEIFVNFVQEGSISFLGGCYGEGVLWDVCEFFIDDTIQFSYGALQTWETYSFPVSAGMHVFKWSYSKDGSENSYGDAFFVDDIVFSGTSRLGDPGSSYNIYRGSFDAATGGITNETLIAQGITGYQYIDVDWKELAAGDYQFGVENPAMASTGIFWAPNILNKSTVDYFTVTTAVDPATGGTVSDGGTFAYGEICTVTAVNNDWYEFGYWTKNGIEVSGSESPTYSFPVTEDVTIQAHFDPMYFYYEVYAVPEDGGEAIMVGEVADTIQWVEVIYFGDTVTLRATPNDGFSFANWTAKGIMGDKSGQSRGTQFLSDSATCNVIITEDLINNLFDPYYIFDGDTIEGISQAAMISFIANFEEGIGDCKRPKDFANIDLGPDFASFRWTEKGVAESWYICYHPVTPAYTEDIMVEVTENPCTITGLQPETLYQAFVVPSCGVEAGVPNSIVCSSSIMFTTLGPCPTPLHVEVPSVTGSTATVQWMDYSDSYNVRVGQPDLILNESFDNGIPADFVNDRTYPWTVVNGRMQSGNAGVTSSSSSIYITVNFLSKGIVEFDAECMGEGINPIYDKCMFTIDNDTLLYAGEDIVGLNHYRFEVTAGEHILAWSYTKDYSENPAGDFFAVDNLLIIGEISWDSPSAVEEAQHIITGLNPVTFYAVSVQGVCEGEDTEWSNPVFFTTNNAYTITVNNNPIIGGTVTGGGEIGVGDTCTLVATPNEGYHFVNWTEGGVVLSTNTTYSFVVDGERTIVANFEINNYAITATANPTAGGTITGANTYNHFEECTLTATPATGYHFVKWTKDGAEVSTTASYSFQVTEAATYVAHFELNSYTIAATANPTVGGTVSGTGTYNHFDECTLTATASDGYSFEYWSENGVEVSRNFQYTFTVEGARTLVANFSLDIYAVAAVADPAEGGTISGEGFVDGEGAYAYGSTCTLTATPATGYHFVNWTKDGAQVSTSATYSFTVTVPVALVAHFELNSYTIAATANPAVGGTVSGTGTYNHFGECTLTATASDGYSFEYWSENGVEVSRSFQYTFTVEGARTLVANFSLDIYAIAAEADPAEGGTISGEGFVDGEGAYAYGSTCTLTATPATGYHFVNWTKDGTQVSTSATYSFTVTVPTVLVAHFELNSYAITATANPTAGGTITGANTYNHFEECTLTATPATGYHFVKWTKNGTQVSTTASYSFTVTGAANYVAHFELNSYQILVEASPEEGGLIDGSNFYNHFDVCTVTATPRVGYHFVHWIENNAEVSTNAQYTFTVVGERHLFAIFELNSYAITATANPTEGGTITGANTYNHFDECTLTATPATGYHFVNWTEGSTVVSTNASYSFQVTGARTLVAHFEINGYTITAMANPTAGGTITGAGNFNHFETCTLTATPNVGYYFVRWTKGSEIVSTEAEYSFEVTETATYKAHFAKIAYAITAEANPEEGGTITGMGESFYYNTTCQLKATANTGYHFVNWTKDGVEVSTNRIYNFTVTESAHFVANFELDTFVITASVEPGEGGTVTGGGTYNYGETVTLTAEANTDYQFVNWTENDEVVSEEATYTFEADSDRQLVAHFISTWGVGDHNALNVSIYPNPAVYKLNIEASEPIDMLEIYNINGALVSRQKDCSDKVEIHLESYAPGTYMIRLTTNSTVEIRKFVKE